MTSRLSIFPITAEISTNGHLAIGGRDVVDLTAEFGTPLYVFDEATIRQRCRDFREVFSARYEETTIAYASKAYLSKALISILKSEDMALDVVSGTELEFALQAGFPADMIYFHGNNKSTEELQQALRCRVGRIVVDNLDELEKLVEIADNMRRLPDILLRVTPGVDPHTHAHITTGKLDSKFGLPLFMASSAVARAMKAPSLNLVGFHFHIGSQVFDLTPYEEAIDIVFDFAATMNAQFGFELEELDIGGGFAVSYLLGHNPPTISEYANAIVSHFVAKSRELKLGKPQLTVEPGRGIIAQAGVALYRIGAIKDLPGIRHYVSVDGGMADNIRPALYQAQYDAVVANKLISKEEVEVTIAGRYCESGDILVKDINLPQVTTGDIVAIPACGAYCLPMASNYNMALKPAVVMVKDGQARLVRRRESLEDLSRLDLE
jgi:diaminopimelate decarboxylase